jgi:ankyrin repeat protein
MHTLRRQLVSVLVIACILSAPATGAPAKNDTATDALEPVHAALRTLQFDRAIELLGSARYSALPEAQYLLGLMYLNGIGTGSNPERARTLLQAAAEHGQGAAAFVLAGELFREHGGASAASARQWLAKSAQLGYPRAVEALRSNRPLLDREWLGASDPTLLTAWILECVRKDDAAELRRLGTTSATVRDEFGRTALSHAAEAGTLAAATALLELGADVAAIDRAGTTSLMIAAERPDRAMVELLLSHGADLQAVDAAKRTAIFYAARANQPQIVRMLENAGAKTDAVDEREYNALDDALAVGSDAAASELRALGVHANLVTTDTARQTGKFDAAHPGDLYRGWPAIALAVARNDTTGVQANLDAGSSASLRLPQGDSLLQTAANAHALESLALLLAHGADASAPDQTGHSVLWLATVRGDLPVVGALLAGGVLPDTHAIDEKTPLLAALQATPPDVTEKLLAAGANPNVTDERGRTPLMLASASGQLTLVQMLLVKHAKTDAEDHERRTALWYAAASGSHNKVDALLAAGGIQQVSDAYGLSVLHAAATQPDPAVLEPLFKTGARINERSLDGDTPLLIAAAQGHAEVVKALLARSPDLNLQNNGGDTALIVASRAGYTAVCRLLLAAGANAGLRNSAGVSAADVASGRGFAALAKALSEKS